eukprot:3418250-Rhodomonas_salina.2
MSGSRVSGLVFTIQGLRSGSRVSGLGFRIEVLVRVTWHSESVDLEPLALDPRSGRSQKRKPEGQKATKRCGLVVAVFLTQADGCPTVGIQD